MEFLIENNLVENTPNSIAQFLFSGEGLNKTSIGNYLGEKYYFFFYQIVDFCIKFNIYE